MEVKEAVIKRIKVLCKEKGVTLNSLAYLSGITPSTIFSFMNPKRKNIGIVAIKKICDGLDIKVVEFFDDDIFRKLNHE